MSKPHSRLGDESVNTQITQCGLLPLLRLCYKCYSYSSWSNSDCLSMGPYGIWHVARACIKACICMIPSFFLASVLGFLCSHILSAPHFTIFTWPEAPTINCTSIYFVRKCVCNSWCNLLYTFNAASHDDSVSDLHHLSEIESGELEHTSDKS
jgi:hypothetical protein